MRLSKHVFYLSVLIIISLASFTWNNSFILGIHPDETKKVANVLGAKPDFKHPLLLIKATQLLSKVSDSEGTQQVVETGRLVSALAATLTAILIYFAITDRFGSQWGFFGAMVFVFSPLTSIHAHYMKEDMLQTMFLTSTMLMLQKLNTERKVTWIWISISIGLGLATHYKSFLMFVILLFIFLKKKDIRSEMTKKLLLIGFISSVVFILINYELFDRIDTFATGPLYELMRVVGGNKVDFYPLPYFFSFHLFNSLFLTMGGLVIILSLIGVWLSIKQWKSLDEREYLWLMYLLIFYVTIELSPFKPHPDFTRYAVPCVPAMIFFAVKGIRSLAVYLSGSKFKYAVMVITLSSLAIPAIDSYFLIQNLEADTRIKLTKELDRIKDDRTKIDLPTKFYSESYVNLFRKDVDRMWEVDPTTLAEKGITHIIVSSFMYDRYLKGKVINFHTPDVYTKANYYQKIFETFSYTEIEPAYRSYAFSNPVLRIVDISSAGSTDK